jgi:ATP-binding cassette, subfamily B, multidrug efflux pump
MTKSAPSATARAMSTPAEQLAPGKPAAWEAEDGSGPRAKAVDPLLLKRLKPYLAGQWARLFEGLGLLLLMQVARLAQPTLIAILIDHHLLKRESRGNWEQLLTWWDRFAAWAHNRLPGQPGPVLLIALCFGVCAAGEYVARRRQAWVIDLAGQNALFELRQRLFAHLQRLSCSFYDRTPVGKLVGRVTSDVEALQELFSSGVVTILGDFVNLTAMALVLLWLDWKLAVASFLAVPILLYLTAKVRGKVRACYEIFISRRSRLASFLHESISGMALLQAYGREPRAQAEHDSLSLEIRDSQIISVSWEALLSALTELIGSFVTAAILWLGGSLLLAGLGLPPEAASAAGLTLGVLFLFTDYMGKFFQPLTDLSLKYTVLQSAMTAAAKIFSLMDVTDVIPERPDPPEPPAAAGRVEFSAVEFSYPNRPAESVLRGITFRVEPGEHVAVVGATGSGKTSMLKLLVRLYDPTSGGIRLDGQDVRDYSLAELRRRIAVVPQDVFLFEGTILENLALGGRSSDGAPLHPEQALAAARRLGLDEIVKRFESGYQQRVAERGKNFSSGERQLIAFARALAAAPEVVVLDEATSNVDTQTEALLQHALDELLEGRTALVIAHRLSTVRHCNRILVLDRGQIVEQGTHQELLAAGGHYARLYERQYRGDGAAL